MRIDERTEGEVVVLTLRDSRLDERGAPDLKNAIAALVARGVHAIVLDVAAVETVDSSALGAIVAGFKLLGGKGHVVISGAGKSVANLLRTTRMDKVIRMFDSVESAARALSNREASER